MLLQGKIGCWSRLVEYTSVDLEGRKESRKEILNTNKTKVIHSHLKLIFDSKMSHKKQFTHAALSADMRCAVIVLLLMVKSCYCKQ